ncbi:MAG: polysaccharide pyruvyl transferase family protein [Beijerinckiaceae bacterium]|nr:polysaccharide pyruvyl transferase family protein [Beijerinckiaceae bacterium]
MKTRPIFVKNAGRRVRYDEVSWYDWPFRQLIDSYFNTGDCAVWDSTLKLLAFNSNQNYDLNIQKFSAADIEKVRGQHDFIVLRGSNYIHPHMDWECFLPWLEAIELPVMCLGVGAQAASRMRMELPPEGKRIWKIISERTKSIGVRGTFTAEVLNDNGIKNAEVVGCPTLFRHRKAELKLKPVQLSQEAKVSFSIRRETGAGYTNDPHLFLRQQREMIERLSQEVNLFLTAHGETEEKVYYYRDPKRLAEVRARLIAEQWFAPDGGLMEHLYQTRLFFSDVVEHLDAFMTEMDATIGYRVHGILPSMAQGIPGVLLEYDTRSKELAESLGVPCLPVEQALKMPLSEIFSPDRFAAFEAAFPANYQRMKDFLDSNGFANRM